MKAKSLPALGKPLPIKCGNVTVKIYVGENRVNGTTYRQFTLAYYDGTKRVKKRFADLQEAKREAELTATKLANGESQVLRLTSLDRANYLQAIESLRPLGRQLNLAVAEYVEAVKLLPPNTSLREAVADFARRTSTVRESRTVSQLVVEYIATKERAGRSERHVRDLRQRLTRFGKAFHLPVAHLTGKMLQAWLDGLKLSNRTKLNELRHVSALIHFAVRRKYAPRDLLDELEAVERPEVAPSPTLIFTPGELRELFTSAPAPLVPWLVFGGYCGLRSAEILRLEWRDVNLNRRFVEVRAINAKTAQRRLVPLCDAAVAWLTPHAGSEGRVACHQRDNWFYFTLAAAVNQARRKQGNKNKFLWKRNGLRHSFCSYRLAVTQDAAKTSLEAGNSPQMIFRHYRELTTEDEAKEWFAILPPKPAAIVPTGSITASGNAKIPASRRDTPDVWTIQRN
jgi:integrase